MSITPTNGDAAAHGGGDADGLVPRARGPGLAAPRRRRRAGQRVPVRRQPHRRRPGRDRGRLHAVRPDLVIATDEEGGDVTRLGPRPAARSRGAPRSVRSTTRPSPVGVAAALGAELSDPGHRPRSGPRRGRERRPGQPGDRRPLVRRRTGPRGAPRRRLRRRTPGGRRRGRASSTFPATGRPRSTRTSTCPSSTFPDRYSNDGSWCRSGPRSRPASRPS